MIRAVEAQQRAALGDVLPDPAADPAAAMRAWWAHVASGMEPEFARAHGRLGIAVTRGLLLDLLATGDREGVDAAVEAWIAINLAASG